jgi:2-C-methyl-D-erythritol 4-phosphate cytidylyltransferase / 2-C-methyl-D-erythritol 2,4-cyclodiphosphate synthase
MQKTKNASVIIVAAGLGSRYSETENKVLSRFNGISIFEYSIETFQNFDSIKQIILVGQNFLDQNLLKKKYSKLSHIVPGGECRQISVYNGLLVTKEDYPFVFIHDAARPFFINRMLEDMLNVIETCDGVIPLLPLYDAIKEKTECEKVIPHPSKNLFRTQTPQLYKKQILINAFHVKKDSLCQYRDEMELLTAYQPDTCIKSVKGHYLAEKITTQEEMILLKKLLPKIVKTGIGYDFHPFIPEKPLILGGCFIPYVLGLEGDSDGDVLCHSILDSILGALSLGDIGRYIGIKTTNAIGATSLDFLKQLVQDESIAWFQILHIDATIVCKEPLLNPWMENMVECLTKVMKIDQNQINLKSTTDKGIDGAGEGKGIRVISIATIEIFQRRDEWQTN